MKRDPQALALLPPEEQARRALATAFSALARRPRSQAELGVLLRRKGFAADAVERALDRLRELGYLDDRAIADAAVRTAVRRGLGRRRVEQLLARRGLSGELAREAAARSAEGELERARGLLSRFPTPLEDVRAKGRAFRFLVARGFPGRVADQAVRSAAEPRSGGDE